ncbi:early nodulin-93-like protein [Tanacetum coccineum]
MGIPTDIKDAWVNHHQRNNNYNNFVIQSPEEDLKYLRSQMCTQEGVRAGLKSASIAAVASAVPTVSGYYMLLIEFLLVNLVSIV